MLHAPSLFQARPIGRLGARATSTECPEGRVFLRCGLRRMVKRRVVQRSFETRFRIVVRAVVALGFAVACAAEGPSDSRPDVLLITVDTLRADALHASGFSQDSTPRMDGLAARGVLFERAIAASSRTVPSHASMMTSRWVRGHSVGSFNGSTRLEGASTLAQRFREAGYDTAAFVSNFVLKRRTGLDAGFDTYDDTMLETESNREILTERTASETTAAALAWLADRGDNPVFLWVHYQDPHGPYRPPDSFRDKLAPVQTRVLRDLPVLDRDSGRGGIPRYQVIENERSPGFYAQRYAEEIAYTDQQVGELVDVFEQRSAERESVILLTADHGESLGERGFFFQHGERTSPDQVVVPFIVVGPGIPQSRQPDLVSHVDLAPTLLELASLPGLEDAKGLSLVARAKGGDPLPGRTLFSESPREITAYRDRRYVQARPGPGALQVEPLDPDGALRWYGFERAPDGRWLAAEPFPELRDEVTDHLRAKTPRAAAPELSDEDVARLRALGYLPDPTPGKSTGDD